LFTVTKPESKKKLKVLELSKIRILLFVVLLLLGMTQCSGNLVEVQHN